MVKEGLMVVLDWPGASLNIPEFTYSSFFTGDEFGKDCVADDEFES